MNSMIFLQSLHWREPLWLFLALQPLALWLFRYLRQTQRLSTYADPALLPWLMIREQRPWLAQIFSRSAAYSLAWLLFAVAAAGPRLPLSGTQYMNADAMNIMAVVDVSRSMLSDDVRPNRLRRATLEFDTLLSRTSGQRFGVIVFAARPHVFVPLTWDMHALRYYLQLMDKLVLPTRGSQLMAALSLARQTLQSDSRPAAIVVFSDGDFTSDNTGQRQEILRLARQLKQQHLPLYILGIGSSEGGPIPLDTGGWLSDAGRPVISRMDEPFLQQLARASGGRYSRVSDDDADWQRLYDAGLVRQFPELGQNRSQQWRELYPWALFPAVLLLFAAVIPLRRRLLITVATGMSTVTVIMLGLFIHQDASAAPDNRQQQALHAFQQRDYNTALALYEQVPGYSGHFGAGATYYRKGNYPAAQREFGAAIVAADTDLQRANALFNLGNSFFQQGDYQSAARSFIDVLRYQSDYPAAQNNLVLSRALFRRVANTISQDQQGGRPGPGARTGQAPEDLELTQNLAASINAGDSDKTTIIPPLPDTPDTQKLINRGLVFARLAARAKTQGPTVKQQQAIAEARLFMLQIEERPAILWQSLFEQEEGFAAPQPQPNVIPGKAPW